MTRPKAPVFQTVIVVAAACLAIGATAKAARNGQQVIFSTPGSVMQLFGNAKASETPFGFWNWCIADAAPNGGGPYQSNNACQGNMYFYLLDKHANPVIGFASEGDEGIYTMHMLEGTLPELIRGTIFGNADFACELTNEHAPDGPHGNAVDVACSFSEKLGGGYGTAHVENVVVNVTGPTEE